MGRSPKAIAVDSGLALLTVAVTSVAIAARLDDGRPGWSTYWYAIGFGALVMLRRRWPIEALLASAVLVIAYHALDNPAIPLAIPVAVALYSAAEQGHVRWAAGVATALLVVSTIARINEGDSVAVLVGYDLASQAGLMAATVLLGDAVRARRGLRVERAQEASRRVEAERLRIARELHDELAHTLSVITLHSDVAREALDDANTGEASQALAAVREAAGDASRELRATVGLLRADAGPAAGLHQVDALIQSARDSGLRVELLADRIPDVPAVVGSTAYRIVQEALTNVLRHAQARSCTVELRHGPDALCIRISDDGRGAVSWAAGFGLTGMRERAGLLGGTVAAGPGKYGWVVEAVLPIEGAS